MAHEPARLELVDQPVRPVMELAPSVEMGPKPRVRSAAAHEPVQQAGGGPRRQRWRRDEG